MPGLSNQSRPNVRIPSRVPTGPTFQGPWTTRQRPTSIRPARWVQFDIPPYVKCEGPVPPGPVFTGPAGSTCPTGNFLSACPVPSTPALSSPVPRQDRVTNLRVTYREKNCDPTPRETTYVSLTFTVQFSAASACRPGARTASDTRNVDRSRETDSCSLPRPIHARGDRVSMRMETTRRLF